MADELLSFESSNMSSSQIKKDEDLSFLNFFRHFGPGLLISIAYLDPGNCTLKIFEKFYKFFLILVSGDLEAGKAAGYNLLWLLMFSTIIGYFFQTLAINIGFIIILINYN